MYVCSDTSSTCSSRVRMRNMFVTRTRNEHSCTCQAARSISPAMDERLAGSGDEASDRLAEKVTKNSRYIPAASKRSRNNRADRNKAIVVSFPDPRCGGWNNR